MRAGLGPTREGRFLLPGDDRRPADVLLPQWDAGRDGALDVTVIHPFQAATVAQAALEPGHALQFAHDRKVRGAAEDCQRQGIFFPLWWSRWVGGTPLQRGRSKSWAAAWQGTLLGSSKGKPSPTSGECLAFSSREETLLFWGTVCPLTLSLPLMALSEDSIYQGCTGD